MILPHGSTHLILLMLFSMLCWGSWPIFYKLAKRYRFELFYFDFAFGVVFTAIICAFTLGSVGFDGFAFLDDLNYAHKQDWVYAFGAAMVFNFGNMLMFASMTVAGMAVAFPLTFGVALIVSSWMGYLQHPAATTLFLIAGTVLAALSLIVNSSGYSHRRILQHEALARAGKTKTTRRPSSFKGIILAMVGGLVMGCYAPLLGRSQDPDVGLGPYSLMVLFSLGVAVSTFILNLFLMNLPVEGDPLEIRDYFRAHVGHHLLGLIAGAIWTFGALASFVVATPKGVDHLSAPLDTLLANLTPVVAALWGLVVWKEFKGGDSRATAFAVLTLILFTGGALLFSCAPLWATAP